MKLTDPRLWQAANIQDFLFRLHFDELDQYDMQVEHSFNLISYQEFTAAGFVAPSNTRVFGLDISHWNGIVDLSKAKALGCAFVIIKGCDGSIPTKNFEQNKANAKLNGLPWAVYDWLYSAKNVNILTQTTAWSKQVKNDYPPLGVFVDFEWTRYGGKQSNPNSSDLTAALNSFEALAGKRAGIYSAKGYTDSYLTKDPKWNNYKWWVANYGVTSPLMPVGVTAWTFWQFTNFLDGISLGVNTKEADGNYYHGTIEQFKAEFGLSDPTPNPDPDEGENEMAIEDAIKSLEATISAKFDTLTAAVKAIPSSGGGGGTTPPPNPTTAPQRVLKLKLDEPNKLVATYDVPDVNGTKGLIFQSNSVKEGIPPLNRKGTPKESDFPEPLVREIEWRNLFRNWAWIPKQPLYKPNMTVQYVFPDIGKKGTVEIDISDYPGMWMERRDIATTLDSAFLEQLVAYAMRTDR